MTPQQLRRRNRDLDPNSPLLEDYALQPPVMEDTVDLDLPEVSPDPDYVDQEDPITRYSSYGVDEFNKLKETEPDELKRRGPWHQILGGLADMTTVTRGLVPNLVYHNYDEVMNQTGEYNRQKERADLESRNRGDSLRAGTSAYGTDVQAQNNEWNQTVGVELEARKRGLAPVNEVPSSLLEPNAPVETINGKSWAPLAKASEVSFSYPIPNPKTNTTDIVVLFKDGSITTQDTGITLRDRNPQTNTNSLIASLNELKQRVQDPDISDLQKRTIESDITKIEKTLEDIQKFSATDAENKARISASYRPEPKDDTDPKRTKTYYQIYDLVKTENPQSTPEELEHMTLKRMYDKEPAPPGVRNATDRTEDQLQVAGRMGTVGKFTPGWFFGPDEEEALANINTGSKIITDVLERSSGDRKESVTDFIPTLNANLDKLPTEFQAKLKDYVAAYNENYDVLVRDGNDLWYNKEDGLAITPAMLMAENPRIKTIEQAKTALSQVGYMPHKFVSK